MTSTPTPPAAVDQYRAQRSNAKRAVAGARSIWAGLGTDFSEQWASTTQYRLLELVQDARARAVGLALPYTSDVLTDTGQRAPAIGHLAPSRFLETAPDGQEISGLLAQAPIVVRTQIAGGASVSTALDIGGRWLTGALVTMLADTRRSVYEADSTRRPQLTGYVRMLNPPSCPRCVILAGKWFRWNEGFLRHPRCNCQHIPASENVGGDLRTDPYEYFRSLDTAEQIKLFGRQDARAIRDGADIYRVVNIRMRGLATAKSARKYGTPHRLTIEDIYETTRTRDEAIRLMQREGFITGPQRAGGNIVGPYRERYTTPISRPERSGSARARVLEARRTGVRDPLDRATMTAQERRIFDAFYRLQYARKHGVLPRTVGMNSADVYAGGRGFAATPERLARLEMNLQAQLSRIRPDQASMYRLVDALGLRDSEAASSAIFDQVEDRMRKQFASATGATRSRRPTTATGAGGAGKPPARPPRRAAAGEPEPDDPKSPEGRAYWRRRQDALPFDLGVENLDPEDVKVAERMLARSEQIDWIPKLPSDPTHDFRWTRADDEVLVEAKATKAKYETIRGRIHDAVKRARNHETPVVKDVFLIDLGTEIFSAELRNELRAYNIDRSRYRIRELWVMSDDGRNLERVFLD